MPKAPPDYARTPDALIAGLARTHDRAAFEELVVRHQGWIRTLMRRCCANVTLADDLAQQVFLQAWRDIPKLKQPAKFKGWLKKLDLPDSSASRSYGSSSCSISRKGEWDWW